MVKILENTEAIESQEERDSRLSKIVKKIFPQVKILSPIGGQFGVLFKEDAFVQIYVYPDRNYIRVINKKHFNKALEIAKKYEGIGEQEFTIKKDY